MKNATRLLRVEEKLGKFGCTECAKHQQKEQDLQRFLADATDEELRTLESIFKAIQHRHNTKCKERGDTSITFYPCYRG